MDRSPRGTAGAQPRVVHFVHSLEIGGAERVVLDLATRARAEGLDHRLLTCDHGFRDESVDFDPGGVPVECIERGPGIDLCFARRVRRWLAEVGAELVHAHNDTPIAYAALAAALPGRQRPALVATFHNLPTYGGRGARLLTRWATRRCAAVTAVSAELGERLARGGWSIPAEIVGHGIDLACFRPHGPTGDWRRRLDVPEGGLLVGMLARFAEPKRQRDLLAAGRLLRRAGLPVTLVFVGEGPERAGFEALLEPGEPVRVLARVPEVADLLRALDLFVLASEHEAAPRALMEALACGLPCVASAVGGVPELAGEGRAAELVPPGDVAALAGALERLARSREERAALGARAQSRARAFSADGPWREWLRIWARGRPRHPADPG